MASGSIVIIELSWAALRGSRRTAASRGNNSIISESVKYLNFISAPLRNQYREAEGSVSLSAGRNALGIIGRMKRHRAENHQQKAIGISKALGGRIAEIGGILRRISK